MSSMELWNVSSKKQLKIVISASAAAPEAFAAEELRSHLETATGARFDIVQASPAEGPRILLGEAARTACPDAKLKHDGFVINFDGETLAIRGDEPRGALNGVYALLRMWGFRWAFPRRSEDVIPELKTLSLELGETVSNPDLELRGACVFPVNAENLENLRTLIDWMAKNRFNLLMTSVNRAKKRPDGWEVEWRAVSDELLPELQKRGIILDVSEHSGRHFFPTWLFDEHPEWFAMNADGERFSTGQICYSNDEAVATLTKNMVEYVKNHPEVDIIGTWPEDGYGFCKCETCEEPGVVLKAVNRIAEAIERVRPEMTVEYLSYTAETSDVPPDILPRRNMAILVANPRVAEEWLSKSNAVGGLGVYRLHYRIADNTAMRANLPLRFEATKQDCQDTIKLGLRGIIPFFIGIDTWWRSSLNLLALAEFSWDSSKSVDEFLDDFCESHYGDVAPEMVEIFKSLEAMPPIHLDSPPPWPLWQNWPTIRTEFAGDKLAAKLAYFMNLREQLATARRKGESSDVPKRRFDVIEAFIEFHETMLAAWGERSLAVLAFDDGDAEKVRKHIVETAKLERRLVELHDNSVEGDDGVNGARCDYDFFQNWRLQTDKQLLEMRTDQEKKPFIDNNPDVELFLPGLLGAN